MKKNIFLFSALMAMVACSTKKDAFANRTYQNFTSYYNGLFHGKEALKSELSNHKKQHKDNFHEGYLEIFTQNTLANLEEDKDLSAMAGSFFGGRGNTPAQSPSVNLFQKAENKALNTIEKRSMIFKGVEKNKEIFNAYILLAEARIYQGKLFEALDALNQIYYTMPKDSRLPLAKIYEGLIYSRMKNYIRAEEIFYNLDRDANIKKQYRKLLSIYYAENQLYANKKDHAIELLNEAMSLNKLREIRSRIAYLRGQILLELGKNEEARESFVSAYRYANDFNFEVKSQIQIAKTFGEGDNYEEAKRYLEKNGKKGTYIDQKNEFYYALGLVANKAGKEEEAQEYFQKSIKEKSSDNHIRGLAYYEIGNDYFGKQNYIRAGAYYDSALVEIRQNATAEHIREKSENIKKVSEKYYLVKKNDSILALTKMSEAERTAYFQKHIEALKEKEAQEEALENKKSRNRANVQFTNDGFSGFENSFGQQKSNKFYFANQDLVAKGSLEFKKLWGNRSLRDNWRLNQNSNAQESLEDLENKALGRTSVADARRFEVGYYTEKIPTNATEISKLKEERDLAILDLGRMYEAYFQNIDLATQTLYDLVEQNPEEEVRLQALYAIFSMNFEKNPTNAERAKNLILQDYPYTIYADFVRNPRSTNFTQADDEVKVEYQKVYALYEEERFEEAQKLIEVALEKYQNDALIPKFELLNAFITGKTEGKDIMILQLENMVLAYGKTPEGIKAQEILKFLKEGLEETEVVETPTPPQQRPPQRQIIEEDTAPQVPIRGQRQRPSGNNRPRLERPVQTWEKGYLRPADD